jgi:catechol 2,3-dioxygenase-like lactoylglutathione lyase family enzyme
MFDHVTIGVSDFDASKRFYDAGFAALNLEPKDDERVVEWGNFSIASERPVTTAAHVALQAHATDMVDQWYEAAMAAGGRDNGPPGPRPQYGGRYYAAYVLDPDGVNVEAVYRPFSEWAIDHVILGVDDLDEARRFYSTVLRTLGRSVIHELDGAVAYGQSDGALWVLQRPPPTEAIHFAITTVSTAAVDAFWQAGTEEGFTSNGEPGERTEYSEGYYAAYLLDPGGNNVEAVFHG